MSRVLGERVDNGIHNHIAVADDQDTVDPIITGWLSAPDAPPLTTYAPGSWGPVEADQLLARADHLWRMGCSHDA